MTVALEEFSDWRDSVEDRLGKLEAVSEDQEEKVEYHKNLIGSMDYDLSEIQVEFRVQRGMLQALHDTQTEHTKRFRKMEGRLGNVEEALGTVKAGITVINGKLDLLISGQ